jgi:cell wall integrity and stress response component
VGGVVQTVTVSPDATATSDPALSGVENNAGLQTGAIVGIVIGVIGGLLVLAAFIWLFLMKRRKENQNAGTGYISPIPGGGSPGTMTTPTTGEISGGGIFAAGSQSSGKRRSYLMPVDPRLDPFRAGGPNKSRESFTSLQDNEDYSRPVHEPPRVLRATNPDPDDD